ncbi:CAP domain-containing protein [Maledivibacter halophilus]|uniref:Spore coat assembly protein SafA/uncharacterized protein, YkwD family n=1 Tax=Maledivibacter halophilus TaxID=36842 RepID=A0A1T5I913_9FIRM|nr:CAP domain-containing protein [Maledivibacter halophilus]SKC35523.1 spore coat assembly protein SafA/uncharacterized protein, YkwD family [Maledivibacter halophilus]
MKKNRFLLTIFTVFCLLVIFNIDNTNAQSKNNDIDVYIVKSGDSLGKISVRYKVSISEIIAANTQFENPNLIYPGDKVYVPLFNTAEAMEKEVAKLTNIERQKYGLSPLNHNYKLSRVGRYKSEDMKNGGYFNHTSSTYGSPFEMMSDFKINYSTAGENIAMGQKSAQDVVRDWMNSSGHRANILSKNFTEMGVGYAKSSDERTYWTQMFIKP